MASRPQVVKLLFFLINLVLVSVQLASSSDHVLKGSVTCLDCDLKHHNDLSDIKVLMKCSNVKKMVMATTKEDGTFETKLPQDMMMMMTTHTTTTSSPHTINSKCSTKIVGGSSLLYTLGKNTISRVVKIQGQDYYYTNEEPLNFYKSCPKQKNNNNNNAAEKCASAAAANFGSSKTVDIPLPREWGLAPSSYYVPFIPIIGIP